MTTLFISCVPHGTSLYKVCWKNLVWSKTNGKDMQIVVLFIWTYLLLLLDNTRSTLAVNCKGLPRAENDRAFTDERTEPEAECIGTLHGTHFQIMWRHLLFFSYMFPYIFKQTLYNKIPCGTPPVFRICLHGVLLFSI